VNWKGQMVGVADGMLVGVFVVPVVTVGVLDADI